MGKVDFLYSHKNKFNQLLKRDQTYERDVERRALFYIIAGNEDLYNKVEFIYDNLN